MIDEVNMNDEEEVNDGSMPADDGEETTEENSPEEETEETM